MTKDETEREKREEKFTEEDQSMKNQAPKDQEVTMQRSGEKEESEDEKDLFDLVLDDLDLQEDKRNIIIQYRIINNHGIIARDGAQLENIQIDTEKNGGKKQNEESERRGKSEKNKNILSTDRQLSTWLSDNYEAYPMALMIAVAVFDHFPYVWVTQAADILYYSFEQAEEEKKRNQGITDLISDFGAEICDGNLNTYTGKISIDVVQLAEMEHSDKILRFIWREYPEQRNRIIAWLKAFSMKKPMSMAKQALVVMGKLACWDYYYFLNNMVRMIPDDQSIATDMMLAQIVISLNSCRMYRDHVENLVMGWNRESNVHYLLTNLFICAEVTDKISILEDAISSYINKAMDGIRAQRKNEYLKNIYNFFAAGMRAFTFYRILIDQLYNLISNEGSVREKRYVCNLFLRFFIVDLDLARLKEGEDAILIRLCQTNQETGHKLCALWEMVWQCKQYRQMFYRLMAKYNADIRRSGNLDPIESFVKKAFGNICTNEMQRDICSKIRRRTKDE